jgi:hypothetical protein
MLPLLYLGNMCDRRSSTGVLIKGFIIEPSHEEPGGFDEPFQAEPDGLRFVGGASKRGVSKRGVRRYRTEFSRGKFYLVVVGRFQEELGGFDELSQAEPGGLGGLGGVCERGVCHDRTEFARANL